MDANKFYGRKQADTRPIPDISDDELLEDSSDDELYIPTSSEDPQETSDSNSVSSGSDVESTGPNHTDVPANGKYQLKWNNGTLMKSPAETIFKGNMCLPADVTELQTPFQCFSFLFPAEIIQIIEQQTELYSAQLRPDRPISVSTDEIEQFIGTLIWMSLMRLPKSRRYWGSKTKVPQVADVMSLARWEEIKRFLHIVDNNSPQGNVENDRLCKIRPMLDLLQERLDLIPVEEHLCVDEQIIAFKGRSRMKQYLPKKPHKWGYKVYVLSGISGFAYKLEIYTGRSDNVLLLGEKDCGASGNVVVRLCRDIPRNVNHKIYFDNYFNSPRLQAYLLSHGIFSLGTVRPNRIPANSMTSDKDLKVQGRGSYQEMIANVDGETVSFVKWHDNRPVNLLSTFVGSQPETSVTRWDSKQKSKIEVKCPQIVAMYNKHMGGVDLLDSLLGLYRIPTRSKKYYFRIFTHLIDVTVVNAWLLYKRIHNTKNPSTKLMSLYDFKTEIAEGLIACGKTPSRKRGRPSKELENKLEEKQARGRMTPVPIMDVRMDCTGHWPLPVEKKLRCKLPGCKSQTRMLCEKCQVALCLSGKQNCFKLFHTT